MSKAHEANDEPTAGPKIWKCGDDFLYPIPALGQLGSEPSSAKASADDTFPQRQKNDHDASDSWNLIFKSRLKEVNEKCDAWKDEVNNLLLFASLFSAVVTAFVIPPTQDRSTPLSQANIVVGSLWFSSLILSLTTVVIGIISLQWIREHQRYSDIPEPKVAVAVLQMRQESFENWYVKWTFYGLPLLLLSAFILFLVGMILFLLGYNTTIAIPSITFIGATFLFLILTTIAPGVHDVTVSVRPVSSNLTDLTSPRTTSQTSFQQGTAPEKTPSILQNEDSQILPQEGPPQGEIPSPCPYKSPQSWIFRTMLGFAFKGLGLTKYEVSAPRYFGFADHKLPMSAYKPKGNGGIEEGVIPRPTDWSESDRRWLWIRDWWSNYKDFSLQSWEPNNHRRPNHDHVKVLSRIMDHSDDPNLLFAAYHCFSHISHDALKSPAVEEGNLEDKPSSKERNELLRRFYLSGFTDFPITTALQCPTWKALHEENLLVFCQKYASSKIGNHRVAQRYVGAHMTELHSRLVGAIIGASRAKEQLATVPTDHYMGRPKSSIEILLKQYRLYSETLKRSKPGYTYWSSTENVVPIDKKLRKALTEQLLLIQSTFIKNISDVDFDTATPDTLPYGRSITFDFLDIVPRVNAIIQRYNTKSREAEISKAETRTLTQTQESVIAATVVPTSQGPKAFRKPESIFNQLNEILTAHLSDAPSTKPKQPDFIFLCACLILNRLFDDSTLDSEHGMQKETMENIQGCVKAIVAYENKIFCEKDEAQFHPIWRETKLPIRTFSYRPPASDGTRRDIKSRVNIKLLPSWLKTAVVDEYRRVVSEKDQLNLQIRSIN